jgi:hypothetical protein
MWVLEVRSDFDFILILTFESLLLCYWSGCRFSGRSVRRRARFNGYRFDAFKR